MVEPVWWAKIKRKGLFNDNVYFVNNYYNIYHVHSITDIHVDICGIYMFHKITVRYDQFVQLLEDITNKS